MRSLLRAALLAAVSVAHVAVAEGPLVHPVHAYALEGDAIDLPWFGAADPNDLDAVAIVTDEGIELAWTERRPEAFRLVFRSAADGPRSVTSLEGFDPAGQAVSLPFGSIVVVPMPAPSDTGLAVAFGANDGQGALMRSLRIENRGDSPQRLASLTFAAEGVGRGPLVVAHVPADAPADAGIVPGLARLRASLAERLSDPRSLPPEVTEAALRELLPDASFVDPSELRMVLAPGDAVDVLLTRANYAVDLASIGVMSTLLLSGSDPTGRPWTLRLSTPVRAGAGW